MSFFYSIAYIVLVFAIIITIWIAYHVLREKQRRGKHPEALPSFYNRNIGDVSLTSPVVAPAEQRTKMSGTLLALPLVAGVSAGRKRKKETTYVSYNQSYPKGIMVEPAIGAISLENEGDVDINADVHETEKRPIDMPDIAKEDETLVTSESERKDEPLIPTDSKSDSFFAASSEGYDHTASQSKNEDFFATSSEGFGHGESSYDKDAACDGGAGFGTEC